MIQTENSELVNVVFQISKQGDDVDEMNDIGEHQLTQRDAETRKVKYFVPSRSNADLSLQENIRLIQFECYDGVVVSRR
jgi:hypothetical protein